MKLKSKIVATAVLAASVLGISSAMAAPSITLNLVYLGSTTGTASAATRVAQNTGTGMLLNATNAPGGDLTTIKNGLTQMNLTDPAIQSTTNLKNYFAVYVNFAPDNAQKLYGVGFNVLMPTGMAPVTGNNVADTTTNKLLLWNPIDSNAGVTTWDTAGDFGPVGGDLTDIGIFQTSSASAFAMAVGTPDNTVANGDDAGFISGKGTLLGVFALKFTATGVNGSVGLVGTTGNQGWYNTAVDTDVSFSDAALSISPSITIGSSVQDTPEPASLGVLALGGLALLARRRK